MPEPRYETLHELFALARNDTATAPFDPSQSEFFQRAIFVVGAPRSGTTWLHQLLAAHPGVATGGESHVFCEGVDALLANHADPDPHMMLSTWVTEAELVTGVRKLVDGIFAAMRDRQRPSATHIVDKTPNHVPYAASLARVYPDASFVHIIRDARDVAGSAKDLWGGWSEWRSSGAGGAIWRRAVLDNREHLAPLRYYEVRYEDLLGDPIAGVASILDFVALDHDDEFVKRAVDFGKAPINVRPSDTRIGVRKWSGDARADRQVVLAAGDLMVELGYLTEEERRRIASAASPRDRVDDLATVVSSNVRRRAHDASVAAGRLRLRGARRRRDAVHALGRRVAEAAVAADTRAVSDLLSPKTKLERDGATVATGPQDVAAALVAVAGGGRVAAVDADLSACAVQLVATDGARHLHRYFVEGDRIAAVIASSSSG